MEGLTVNLIEVIQALLKRVDIKGSEVEAYVAVVNALNFEREQIESFNGNIAPIVAKEPPDDAA